MTLRPRRCSGGWATLAMVLVGLSLALGDPVLRSEPREVWHVAGEGRGTPAVDTTSAYFLSKRHEVVAVDLKSGQVRWKEGTGAIDDEATSGALVLASSGTVVAADGHLVGLDALTGARRWLFDRAGEAIGIYLGAASSGLVFAGSRAGRLYGLRVATGQVAWSIDVTSTRTATVFAPAADDELVVAGYLSSEPGRESGLVAVEALSGRERWRWRLSTRDGTRFAGGPLVTGDEVVVADDSGAIHTFGRRDGRRRWSIPGPPGSDPPRQEFRALARAGGFLFAGSLAGWVTAYDFATRRERWRKRPVQSSVAFGLAATDTSLYVPYLSGHLAALRLGDGEEEWRTSNGARGFSWVPTTNGSRVYVSASHAGFFAFSR